jgi:hypothetical protein
MLGLQIKNEKGANNSLCCRGSSKTFAILSFALCSLCLTLLTMANSHSHLGSLRDNY